MKRRVGVLNLPPLQMVGALAQQKVAPEAIAGYLEAHLPSNRDNEALLGYYALTCMAQDQRDRCVAFLRAGLQIRPVAVEWHRIYQSTAQVETGDDAVLREYDAMLAKEPESSALLYLRGRLSVDLDVSFKTIENGFLRWCE